MMNKTSSQNVIVGKPWEKKYNNECSTKLNNGLSTVA